MNQLLWVALGGALGSVARYGVSQWMGVREAPQFPWHTFSINVAGCLAYWFGMGTYAKTNS
jgi:CrcB protein